VNVNSLVYKHFKANFEAAGLPNIRLYDLRHTAATLALTVGVSPKVCQSNSGTPAQHSHWMYSRMFCRTCRMMLRRKSMRHYLRRKRWKVTERLT